MNSTELISTSFDHDTLKASLINYLQSKPGFENINFEGSAYNTIIDLLVRNSVYSSFQANMIANESFIDSAQIRANVSSHAQKLSYLPKSRTAARALIDINIIPSEFPTIFLLHSEPGLPFISSIGNQTYTFMTRDKIAFTFNKKSGLYIAEDVEIYQGQFLQIKKVYDGSKIIIENRNIDTSTLRVIVNDSENSVYYNLATNLTELGSDKFIFFLRENINGLYEIDFGKGLLGNEPNINSIITLEYINTEEEHANNTSIFLAASTIDGNSNIVVNTKQNAYGGHDRDTIENIRFLAPKAYQAQDRALAPSDYELIIKREFPFINSVKSWGGELNEPPIYGSVMISIVPEAGLNLTNTLTSRIVAAIREKNVGSVTPIIVPADVFQLDLNVRYKLRDVSSSGHDVYIQNTISNYSKNNLRKFNSYFNESELVKLIKDHPEIESVMIDKIASRIINSHAYKYLNYEVKFGNKIKEKTFSVTEFSATNGANSEIIGDDGLGKIIYEYVLEGVHGYQTIGSLNYATGVCSFDIQFVHSNPSIIVSIEPDDYNFYVSANAIVEIDSVSSQII